MKFQKIEIFGKNLKESFPDHLSSIYLIVCPKEGERQKILDSIASIFQKVGEIKRFSTLNETLEYLHSPSLFAAKTIAFFDGLDGLTKEEMEALTRYVASPFPTTFLVLSSKEGKKASELYKEGKKEIVWLDISAEKPWEETDRIKHWTSQTFAAKKKQIAPDALELLFELFPADRLLLQQEIDKLITYAGERLQITRKDVEALCKNSQEPNLFHVAKQLVWGDGKVSFVPNDVSTLLPLISILRGQLEIGLRMGSYLEQGVPFEDKFPQLRPKAFQECLEAVKEKGLPFFKKGLIHLFDLEFGVKTSLSKPETLFTLFCGKL